jgi:hypothetical protein
VERKKRTISLESYRLLPSKRTGIPVTEHFVLPSKSLFPNESEAKYAAARRTERIESIRRAVQAGVYRIPGELVARRMIDRHLYATIQ